MKDRIIKFLTHENLTATKFADEIGVQRSSVSHILSGRNNPGFEFIQKILARYKYLNADWLILGSGSMLKKMEQRDLFSEPTTIPHVPIQSKIQMTTPISTENLTSPEDAKRIQTGIHAEISASRRIDKIVIFYADKTFEEFLPGENR